MYSWNCAVVFVTSATFVTPSFFRYCVLKIAYLFGGNQLMLYGRLSGR